MKILLASLVAMSVFASDNFVTEKENTVKRLHASNAATSVVTCVENAKTLDEINACEKDHEAIHAKGPHHKHGKTKQI